MTSHPGWVGFGVDAATAIALISAADQSARHRIVIAI